MSDSVVNKPPSLDQPQGHQSTAKPTELPIKRRPRVIERRMNAQHHSHLFRLPIELRLMIYEFALCTPTLPRPQSPTTASLPSRQTTTFDPQEVYPATEPPFLATCRLARAEALPIFYRHNDFLIHRRPSLDSQHPLFLSMNPALARAAASRKRKNKSSGTAQWLYAMGADKIARIRTVLLTQFNRGMWKDEGEWRRDASACFRVCLLGRGGEKRVRGRGWEVQYVRVDPSGRSDRYAERLIKALEARMTQLVEEKGLTAWTREDIWDLAYLL